MNSNTSTHTATKPWPCRSMDLRPGAHSSTKEEGGWWLYGSRVWLHTSHMPWTDGQLSPHLSTQWIPGMDCSIQASCKYCRQESWMDGKMVTWVDTKFCTQSEKPAQTSMANSHHQSWRMKIWHKKSACTYSQKVNMSTPWILFSFWTHQKWKNS